jgi:CHAT domain-containing protein
MAPLDSLLGDAEGAYWAGETDSAKSLFANILERARGAGDPAAEARATTGLARTAYRLDDYRQARELGQAALDLKLRFGFQDQLFDSYNLLGLIAWRESRYFDAIGFYGTARELAEAAADTTNLAKVWTNLALSHIELGGFAEARRLLSRALPAARASGQAMIEGRVLTNLGMLAVRTGAPDSAVGLLHHGLAVLRRAEDPFGEQNNLGQLGAAYAGLGEPGRAIAYLDSAVSQARQSQAPQEEASDLEQLADLHRDAGEFPRALQVLERARAIHAELGLVDESGADLRSAAEIHLALGNLALARRVADSALALHRAAGARLSLLNDHLVVARIAHRSGDHRGGNAQLEAARALAHQMEAPLLRARVALAEARIADEATESDRVLRALAGARADLAYAGQDRDWEIHWLTARAHARKGALGLAATAGRRAVAAVERVRGDFRSGWLRTSYLAERASVYQELVDLLLRLGLTEEAFATADGARGRVLLERLATLPSNATPTARELAEGERQRLDQIERLTQRIQALEARDHDLARRYRTDLERLYAELARVRSEFSAALIRSEEQDSWRAALLGGRPDALRVRASLRPEEALLAFLVGQERVTLFVVTRDTVQAFASPVTESQLAARVRVARELVGTGGDAEAAGPALEALYQALLGEASRAQAFASKRGLIVVPHGTLAYLPFAALRDPVTGRYLIEDHTIMHLPSAAALPALRGGRRPAGGKPLVEAVAFAPFAAALPGSGAEAVAVREGLPGARAVIGLRATEQEVREALLGSRVVHLATHGVLNARSPLFSRVELAPGRGPGRGSADDGRLEVHEVDRAAIESRLVFLSGCETGLGAAGAVGASAGEDYATLARAFLHAGADNVIATLWRIEDQGGAAFATSFYRELAGGRPPHGRVTEALALAQRDLLRQARYRSPFYWAGYQVTGSGDLEGGAALVQEPPRLSVLGGKQ